MAISLVSCVKQPDIDELDAKFYVLTNYDSEADFSQYTSVYVVDSIAIISGDNNDPDRVDDDYATAVLQELNDQLSLAGYTLTTNKDEADLVMTSALIKSTYIGYYPGYWWGYPGYWDPGYWGYPGYDYYYPSYGYYYTYDSGTLIFELLDLKNTDDVNMTIPVPWSVSMGDVFYVLNPKNEAVEGIQQAFDQSPYINKN